MAYDFLADELWPLADEVIEFAQSHWGIGSSSIRKEESIAGRDLGFRPTLHADMRDHHTVCVEVASRPYTESLNAFVLRCRNNGLPVRLYVAVPDNSSPTFQADLREARANGVGVLESSPNGIEVVAEAQSLSLTDVRAPELKRFPASIRARVALAHRTFRGGDPAKGCSTIYDEIEDLTRKLVVAARKAKAWRGLPEGRSEPRLGNPQKDPWHQMAKVLLDHLDANKLNYPKISVTLLARVLGITAQRNESGHKPKNVTALKNRDRKLRTRFEDACDLLQEFCLAIKKR